MGTFALAIACILWVPQPALALDHHEDQNLSSNPAESVRPTESDGIGAGENADSQNSSGSQESLPGEYGKPGDCAATNPDPVSNDNGDTADDAAETPASDESESDTEPQQGPTANPDEASITGTIYIVQYETLASSAQARAKAEPSISYRAHIQKIGWQGAFQNGATAGTSGRALRMEALTITLNTGGYSGGIQMQAHVQKVGWQGVLTNGKTIGTTGKSQRIEALRIMLTGEISQYYDVKYRTHVQKIGWQDWVSNGKMAGTTGKGLRLEAIQLKLEKKGNPSPKQTEGIISIGYQAHVQKVGWQSNQIDNAIAGTTRRALRMEALRIWLYSGAYQGQIKYRVHVQKEGWMGWVGNGGFAGTTGRALRVEAIEIVLSGNIAEKYDIVYSAHIQGVGWQIPRYNGAMAGSTGQARRIEAIKIAIVDKSRRSGWYGNGSNWQYYRSGSPVKGTWVVTSESPLALKPGSQRYWIDTLGNLAVSRVVNPQSAIDTGSWLSYATSNGYVVRGKRAVSGGLMLADGDGRLCSATGWLTTSAYDGSTERYYLVSKGAYSVAKTGMFKVGEDNYYGWTDEGYIVRNGTAKLNGAWYYADNAGKLTRITNLSSKVSAYINWAVAMANDNSHGYSQINRWGPDYDCSSFVVSALKAAGFYVGGATYTGNMVSELTKYGFKYYTDLNKLKAGDILWVHNNSHQHTEIFIGGGQVVGATSSETGGIDGKRGDQNGREIRVGGYYNMPWSGFLRAA